MNHTLLFLGPSDGHEEEREREKSLSPHPPIAMSPPPLSRTHSPPPPPPPPSSLLPPPPGLPARAQAERAARVEERERDRWGMRRGERVCWSAPRILQTRGRQCESKREREKIPEIITTKCVCVCLCVFVREKKSLCVWWMR